MPLPFALIFMICMSLAPALQAQPAIDSGVISSTPNSTLPLRNLQIEVRQIRRDEAQNDAFGVGGQVRLSPGQSSAPLEATMGSSSRTRGANAQQQVLVLNGRRAGIALRNIQPFRLVQTFVINGVMTVVPGTVLIEAGTGFDATARWDGGAQVALDLTASQGQGRYHTQTTSTSTLVVVPLNEWVTVAQSVNENSGSRSSITGQTQWHQDSATEVQVRVNLR